MNINEYLEITREVVTGYSFEFLRIRPRIVCADGFDVSIQASEHHYCSPRINSGPYNEVEIGYPSDEVPEWLPYIESESDDPLSAVYPFVPVEIIDLVLEQHGGIANVVE